MGLPTMVMGIETEYSLEFDPNGGKPGKKESRHNMAVARFRALRSAARSSSLVMGPLLSAVIKDRLPEMGFLGNSSRFYLDGDHPEFSVAECADPRDAVLYDEAGVRIMRALSATAREQGVDCRIYKRSTDGLGHTWGCHENYAISPSLFVGIVDEQKRNGYPNLVGTFMAVRQLLTGAGKVGPDSRSPRFAFQLSPRADFIVKFHSNETLDNRAIINQRNEALADDDQSRRLHVICGEANRMQWATYLKLALTSAFLRLLQDRPIPLGPLPVFVGDYPGLFRTVSLDTSMTARYPVVILHGKTIGVQREMTAVEILGWYVEAISKYVEAAAFGDDRLRASYRTAVEKAAWAVGLLQKGRWRSLYGTIEWATKRVLIDEYLNKKGRTWEQAVVDKPFWRRVRDLGNLNFTAVDESVSIYDRLVKAGRIAEVVRTSEVIRAISQPPVGRAGQRVALASRYIENFTGMDWDRVNFRQPGCDVVFRFGLTQGADQTAFDHALTVCPSAFDLAFFLDAHPVAGIRSEVKAHPEEHNARA